MRKVGIPKILMPAVVLAGALCAQPPRPSLAIQDWWANRLVVSSLNLSDAQTKQLNSIQASYLGRLMELRAAVHTAESKLEDVYSQPPSDELKADAAMDQYFHAKDDLTRTLTKLSWQMRNVLTAEQWEELQNRQAGRAGQRPGPGRGRRGTAPSSSTPNKVGSAILQK
jgi:Spy/CpxP family protein refolding chaperone